MRKSLPRNWENLIRESTSCSFQRSFTVAHQIGFKIQFVTNTRENLIENNFLPNKNITASNYHCSSASHTIFFCSSFRSSNTFPSDSSITFAKSNTERQRQALTHTHKKDHPSVCLERVQKHVCEKLSFLARPANGVALSHYYSPEGFAVAIC